MGSKLKLKNNTESVLTIEHSDNTGAIKVTSRDLNTVTVDTLADLRNLDFVAEYVRVTGYHTKNDGAFGSHVFKLTGIASTEVDNAGTIILANIGDVNYVYELQYDGAVNVKWFGNDISIFDNTTIPNSSTLEVDGTFNIDKAFTTSFSSNVNICGINNAIFNKTSLTPSHYFTFKANTVTKNITIQSQISSLDNIRTEVQSNTILENVSVYNNKHISPAPNAWGFYFKNVDNANLINCKASGNSQSDFTLVDNVKNVSIVGASKGNGSSCILNIEPNGISYGTINNINITSSNFSKVTIIEPFIIGDTIYNVQFNTCNIDNFIFSGGSISLTDSSISTIVAENEGVTSDTTIRAGELKSNCIFLGQNLISDSKMFDVAIDDTSSYWNISSSSITPTLRYEKGSDSFGYYMRINPTNINGSCLVATRNLIDVDSSSNYLLTLKCKKMQSTSTPGMVYVEMYNSSSVKLRTVTVWFNKNSGNTNVKLENAILNIPSDTAKVKIHIGNGGYSTSSIDIYGIRLNKIISNGNYSIDLLRSDVETTSKTLTRDSSHFPTSTAGYYYPSSFKGEMINNSNISAGGYIGWTCITAGLPGTWKGFGLIQA